MFHISTGRIGRRHTIDNAWKNEGQSTSRTFSSLIEMSNTALGSGSSELAFEGLENIGDTYLQKKFARLRLLIIDELSFVPLSKTGAELLFEVFSQRYERGSILVTSNLPFDEWTEVFGSERLTGALLDRLTHRVHILEMNGESYRLKQSRLAATTRSAGDSPDA